MRQKKLKFTIAGLFIYILLAVGFMFYLKTDDSMIWTALMTHIAALIGIFAYANHKDKRIRFENKNTEDIQ